MPTRTTTGITDTEISLGQLLKRFRKDKGLKQKDIAEYLCIERETCSAYETGRSTPSTDKLYKLAKLYGISFEVLASKTVQTECDSGNSDKYATLNDADSKNAEMMYYYKNLDESQKKIVFELVKALYGK
ncbi:MAG: helix-turn-helix transcriptional regulator [Butyrivibrio sp.]|nr:helix-turn-helix transcriptional regulator [Butyrivibrio sp.]